MKGEARTLVVVSALFPLLLRHCGLDDTKDIWSMKTCTTCPKGTDLEHVKEKQSGNRLTQVDQETSCWNRGRW